MTIPKEAIEKAIEGGWKYHDDMVLYDEVIDCWMVSDGDGGYLVTNMHEIALDPSFWQSLGKGLGNKDEMHCDSPKCETVQCEYAGYKDPKRMFDGFVQAVWYGGDTDAFWKELLK